MILFEDNRRGAKGAGGGGQGGGREVGGRREDLNKLNLP